MQVTEIAWVLKGENAPTTVRFAPVGAGCSGEEDLNLSCSIGFTNNVLVRGDADATLHSLKKNVQLLSFDSQAFEFQAERGACPQIKRSNATLHNIVNMRFVSPLQMLNEGGLCHPVYLGG
jgi:hypothetical protein